MLTLQSLRDQAVVITGEEAGRLRQAYIDRFVNTSSDYYKKYIAIKTQFSDGLLYTGYLWDSLKHPEQVKEDQIFDPQLMDKTVYVFWDLHSAERIFVKDYWKFPKDAVLKLKYRDLLAGREFLPEDFYIFDETMNWSIIFTHEYDENDNSAWYLKAC